MKLIHIFYQQKSEHFVNDGRLLLWVESNQIIKGKNFYPYQLKTEELTDWYQTNIATKANLIMVEVFFPCSKEEHPIPSPIICNYCDIDDTEHKLLKPFSIHAIEIESPLSILKSLNFLQYYLDEDIQFANDTKFWIKVGAEIAHVINNDQYIPSIVATEEKSKIKYYRKWQPFSFDFEKNR